MFLVNPAMVNVSVGTAAIIVLLGMAIVANEAGKPLNKLRFNSIRESKSSEDEA